MSVPEAPTAVSSSQRSPHLVKLSTAEGETRTMFSGQLSGRSSEIGVSAYHSSGWAPGTPARASRARCPAAAVRMGSGLVGSHTADRRSATSADMLSQRARSSTAASSTAPGSSSDRNRDGRSSVSSPPTAVTTRRRRARVAAT